MLQILLVLAVVLRLHELPRNIARARALLFLLLALVALRRVITAQLFCPAV